MTKQEFIDSYGEKTIALALHLNGEALWSYRYEDGDDECDLKMALDSADILIAHNHYYIAIGEPDAGDDWTLLQWNDKEYYIYEN